LRLTRATSRMASDTITTKSSGNDEAVPDQASDAATTFYDWPRLPIELKLEVLSHYVRISNYIERWKHQHCIKEHLDIVFGTRNRELVTFALDTYYSKNTFYVYFFHGRDIDYPPPAHGKLVRYLSVCCGTSYTEPRSTAKIDPRQWRHLLHQQEPGQSESTALSRKSGSAWQEHFPNVRDLTLRIFICGISKDGCKDCRFRPADLVALHKWPPTMRIDLRGGKVHVHIVNIDGEHSREDRCGCIEPIKQLFERIVTREG
jgi:hypothetical protein